MDNKKIALEYMSKDKLLFAPFEEAINGEDWEYLYCAGDGILIRNSIIHVCYFTAISPEAANMIVDISGYGDIEEIEEDFVAYDKFIVKILEDRLNLKVHIECFQSVYRKKEYLQVDESLDIRRLGEEYIPFIAEHYLTVPDSSYIEDRVRAGVMHGVFIDEKIAGFIGLHGEKAIGLLEILPEHRKKGLGRNLSAYMVNYMLERNLLPYAQIVVGNTASINLNKSLNFDISTKTITWMGKHV